MTNKLEILLRKAGRELADYQIARFWKFPEEMQQTPCDFMGFTVTGRVIMIEAKMVARTALPIAESPGLLPHQFNALDACNRAGGVALLCWARGSNIAVISFDMVKSLSEGRKSIPWKAIDDRFMRGYGGPDAHLELLDYWLRPAD